MKHELAISAQANARTARVMPKPKPLAHAGADGMKHELAISAQANARTARVMPQPAGHECER